MFNSFSHFSRRIFTSFVKATDFRLRPYRLGERPVTKISVTSVVPNWKTSSPQE